MEKPAKIAPPKGKLGILLPGMGAVSTTFMAGVELVRTGKAQPIGSLTQLGTIRLGKRTDNNSPKIKKFVPLADLDDLVFGGWDLFKDNAYQAPSNAGVLSHKNPPKVKPFLSQIKPMKAAFDKEFVKKLDGTYVKKAKNKYELALQIKEDIANFKKTSRATRLVTCWCASTEVFIRPEEVHSTPEKFIEGMKNNHPAIAPSMLYAWASVTSGVPFANGAPNLTVDIPAMQKLALDHNVAVCGKDFKTRQTLIKTVLAPAFKARMLGLDGWYSTNILGNRDGEVLDDPGSFKTKEKSKMSVLDTILEPERYPMLYGKYHHKVRIDYYPPRGDAKEGWDNIDIRGWMDMPMQIKINFLCRDSILAAPIVLDLVLFLDLAKRAGLKGIQEWLSFYFKSPQCREDLKPEHDLFIQHLKLKNTLRILMGEEVLDHSGLDYYDAERGTPNQAAAPKPAAKKTKKSLAAAR